MIELLVVIAIIGLLVSILLPSLSKARDMARASVCGSNLRQLSHGWHLYADEHKDVSVPGKYPKADGGTANPANWYQIGNGRKYRPAWIATLGKYVNLFAFEMPSTSDERQDYDGKVYQCPTVGDWIDERNHAWGYNYQFLGNSRRTKGTFHNFPVNRSRIKNFASTVLGADSIGTAAGFRDRERRPYLNNGKQSAELGNHAWTLDPPRLTDKSDRGSGDPGTKRTAVDPRHSGKASVLYCDGHIEQVTPYVLGYRTLPGGAYVDLEALEEDLPNNRFFSGTGQDDDPPALPR